MRKQLTALSSALVLGLAGLTVSPIPAAPAAHAATGPIVVGIHDGSINNCDNGEHWVNGTAPPVNGPAAQQVMLNASPNPVDGQGWWAGLHSGTVRVSVPWDIALPYSANASVVTQYDPPGSQWAAVHLQALKNEQACLDWWLDAARKVGVAAQIAFKPDYNYRNLNPGALDSRIPYNAILAPSIDNYRKAITAFTDEYSLCRYGSDATGNSCVLLSGPVGPPPGGSGACASNPCGARVHIIAPWGEPDFASDQTAGNALGSIPASPQKFYLPFGGNLLSTAQCTANGTASTNTNWCGPVLAAQYYMAVLNICGTGCQLTSGPAANQLNSGIVAGDYSGGVGSQTAPVTGTDGVTTSQAYWRTYAQHLNNCAGCAGVRPWTWGVHPYPDVSDFEYCTGNPGNSYPPPNYRSKTVQMATNLANIGYGSNTRIWLNEISVYHATSYNPPSGCQANPSSTFTGRRQAYAFLFLDGVNGQNLPGQVPAGYPQVDRLYYMRAFTGSAPDATYIHPGVFDCLYQSIHAQAVSSSC
ncbi:hypothetical protein ONA70_07045 [Micromonospora yasonensis]|uniref:hypothetical protein n=1 Tax=Micromonospora yasonensis TaxID=1128667 RepID=UPI00223154D0|nr:hypothetical protein [Micromonospora yasonensis]MCW3839852.1 hypothetical protein [Micromonospora yasonensis]